MAPKTPVEEEMEKYKARGIKTHVPGLTKSKNNESWTYIHRWTPRFQQFGGWWTLKKLRYESKNSDVAEVWKWTPGPPADPAAGGSNPAAGGSVYVCPLPSRGLAPSLLLPAAGPLRLQHAVSVGW